MQNSGHKKRVDNSTLFSKKRRKNRNYVEYIDYKL